MYFKNNSPNTNKLKGLIIHIHIDNNRAKQSELPKEQTSHHNYRIKKQFYFHVNTNINN